MKTRSHDLLTTSLIPIAIISLLFSGIYVPTHTSPTSPATKPMLMAAIGTHQDTPSVAETTQRSTHAHAFHVEPSATPSRQPDERSVPNGLRSSPSATQASVSSVLPAVNETAHPQVGNGTSPASAPTTTTRPALTKLTNATTPAGPSLRGHTMTPLVCSMTVSASPLGDFVGQQVTFSASGCTPPSGYYFVWGNLPPRVHYAELSVAVVYPNRERTVRDVRLDHLFRRI